MILNLKSLRKIHYKQQRKIGKEYGVDINDWGKNPYTCIKSIYLIETSAIIVFLLQYTKITPNFLSLFYALLGVTSGVFLASNNDILILISLLLLFSKSSFDWADGLLARIKKKTSELGSLLDDWGGLVGSYSYLCGFGIYLYNQDKGEHFIIITFLIILIKSIDFKNYAYQRYMYRIINEDKKKDFIKKNNKKNKYGVSNSLLKLKIFFQNFLDERSRSIDLICLLIFIDNFYVNLIILDYIYYLIFFNTFMLFCGGFYITYFKNFMKK
tara:strand:+ start:10857 stop:11666 length:810 start_codon:yes stop_codon:yes gene_type:complete